MHKIEKEITPLLSTHFPNYILFRAKYLIPLTGFPKFEDWRNDTNPLLEHLGMSTFAILKSLNFINRNKNKIAVGDPDQPFKNIYFHFGVIADNIESFARAVWLLRIILKIETKDRSDIPTRTELLDQIKKNYAKKLREYKTMGKSIVFIQGQPSHLSKLISKKTGKPYFKLITALKDYRNFYMHNAGVDIISVRGELFTLKKEFVKDSQSWSNLIRLYQEKPENFTNPIFMIEEDLYTLLENLNSIWLEINTKVDEMFSSKRFDSIFKNYNRSI